MTIAILDFGGQYTHLLAQRIRKLHVHSVIIPPTTENLTLYDGIILSGGPHSVNDISAPKYNPNLFNVEVPILGICYGFQLLCKHFGCEIIRGQTTEYGRCSMNVCSGNLFQNVQSSEVWMSHTDTVTTLTDDLLVTAKTDDCIAGVQHVSKKIFGVQFHPEVRHTTCGDLILTNFIKMCRVTTTWNPKNQLKRIIKDIKRIDKNVIVLLSGGVDSAVTFALLNRALGVERVIGLHINNGFMRHKESESVMQVLSELKMSNVVCVDASDDFCKAWM